MIFVVNGYVCTSPCEGASAKQGRDPLPAGVVSRRVGQGQQETFVRRHGRDYARWRS
jgi:hypothetical protein